MDLLTQIKNTILLAIKEELLASDAVQIELNVDKSGFGDLTCNAAMILAKPLGKNPREVALHIKDLILARLDDHVKTVDIAGPGFINITLRETTWDLIAKELVTLGGTYFALNESEQKSSYLIEFVSANPTGPLHIGHGRGGIIGDVLGNVLLFLGHKAQKEFYINDAGSQITKLGASLKVRCQQEVGQDVSLPEECYAGEYLVSLAKECIQQYGKEVVDKENTFFEQYAKERQLELQKQTLSSYGITFDTWFSETSLHKDGSVEQAIKLLREKNLTYEQDGAVWFKATDFGDEKDRVIKKADGSFTYIAADIAYHKNKFERGYKTLINILGQDHHGYVKRLKGTMEALGYDSNNLDVILYQLVSIKHGEEYVKMSKRAGTFEKLSDVIESVGTDVARFFYLNRKADAHLDFDLDIASKTTDENPVYYIQYAYVRTGSLLEKAAAVGLEAAEAMNTDEAEIKLIKKICSLSSLLRTIAKTYQTHLLAYYTLELAQTFHNYYASNKIVDAENEIVSRNRLCITKLSRQTLELCLDLLGLTKPKRM
jgi:arginyl-tRNA synthetase